MKKKEGRERGRKVGVIFTLHRNDSGVEDEVLHVKNVAIVGNDNRHNGNLSLDSQVESTLFEG